MVSDRIFSIGSNGNIYEMEKILEEFENTISSFYFPVPSYICGNGRSRSSISQMSETIDHVKLSRRFGVKPLVLMNSITESGDELNLEFRKKITRTLGELIDTGLEGVVTNSPLICSWAHEISGYKSVDFTIKIGLWAEISTPRDIEVFSGFGADAFCISFDINRDFRLLEAMRKCTTKKLVLLANNGCIYRCPYRFYHRCLQSIYSRKTESERKNDPGMYTYFDLCGAYLKGTRLEMLRTPFIRPEDVHLYSKMGIDEIKLSTRNFGYDWLRTIINCYVMESYEGDIGTFFFRHVKFDHKLDNRRLDGVLEKIRSCPGNEIDILESCLPR
jgi:collagenase-like PrtC family protease